MRLTSPSLLVATLGLALVSTAAGCGNDDSPAPSELRARIATDLTQVLSGSHAAAQGAGDGLPGLGALQMLDKVMGERLGMSIGTDLSAVARSAAHSGSIVDVSLPLPSSSVRSHTSDAGTS